MQKYQNNIAARNGDALVGIKVLVKLAGTATPATIYSDDGVTVTPNPLTTNANGYFEFYVANGLYDIAVNGANAYTDVLIADALGIDAEALKKSEAAASDGATKVGFIQAGSGAVARTLEAKQRDVVSADDYGVPTDGVSDASAAVQAMLDANPGKSVTLLPRTYVFHTGLTVRAGTEIQAWGATLNFSNSHLTGLNFVNGGGIVGARIIGAGNASYNAAGIAILCAGASSSAYVNGPTVQACSIEEWGAYGVRLQYCNSPTIESNSFSGIGYAAVMGLSCSDGRAESNTISDVSPGTASNAYGISWTRGTGTLLADPISQDCAAINNIINGVTIWEGLDTHGGRNITFRGNTISNCKIGISCTTAAVSGSTEVANKNCLIEGNTIVGGTLGAAIRVTGAMTGATVDDYSENCIIRGNKITGGGIAGTIQGAILMQATKELLVSGNVLSAPSLVGVYMSSDNQGFNVSGNTITDPWDNSSSAVACVIQGGNNNVGFIGGNTFAFRNAALGTNVANSSIRFTSATTGNDINVGRNSYAGITTGKLSFANATLAGVNVSQAYSDGGSAVIAVTSAGTSALIDITFSKQFPVTPKIKLSLADPANGGGKLPTATSANKTTTGFRIIVRPFDLSSWSASGNVTVDWEAST